MYGGDGDDELSAGSAKHNSSTGDLLNGGNGNDHLLSSGAGNTLVGSRGDDVLISANGWTRMNGGPGKDSYNGNLAIGHDTFVFSDAGDSTADRPDLIHGLNSNSTIDLTAIDADITTPGDQAFHLVSSLGGHAGELALVYDSLRDTTSIMGDIDGDGTADFVVAIEGDATGFTGFAL